MAGRNNNSSGLGCLGSFFLVIFSVNGGIIGFIFAVLVLAAYEWLTIEFPDIDNFLIFIPITILFILIGVSPFIAFYSIIKSGFSFKLEGVGEILLVAVGTILDTILVSYAIAKRIVKKQRIKRDQQNRHKSKTARVKNTNH